MGLALRQSFRYSALTPFAPGFPSDVVVARVARRSGGAACILEGTPTILIRHGDILEESLRREGISVDDLLRALREHGVDDPTLVRSAILEVDGSISVLRADEVPPPTKPAAFTVFDTPG